MSTLVKGTDFVTVPTQDYEAAAKFYGEVLGSHSPNAGARCPPASSRPAASRSH